MTLTVANLGSSANPDINDNTDLTAYANTAWTPSGDIVFIFCYNRSGAATTPNAPGTTGNSLTWTNIASVVNGVHRMTLVAAPAAGGTNGVTTIDFSGQTQVGCTALFAKATDVELASGIAGAFVQTPSNSATATASTIITAAISAANNLVVGGIGHQSNEVTTPTANWTELDDLAGATPNHGVGSYLRNVGSSSNAAATWATSSAYVGIHAEIAETLPVGPAASVRRRVGRPQAAQRASRW